MWLGWEEILLMRVHHLGFKAKLYEHTGLIFALTTLSVALVAPARAADTIIFTDITASAGVGQPGVLNESVAWGDYNNDGAPDLYLTNNGANKLFRNDGGGAFTDVTATTGVGNAGFSVGTAFGDMDNDGDLDLYVVNFGIGPDAFYRNDGPVGVGGEYQFTDVTASAGVTNEDSSRGMALIDYDRDGLLDVYVNAIGDDILYHNDGNLQFSNTAAAVGITGVSGQGVGVVATDINNDGWVDLFTGNRSGQPNRLFINNQGTFVDETVSAGIDKVGLGMGVASLDYDNDLDMDLVWTTWPGATTNPNAFYENTSTPGNVSFTDVAVASGTTDPGGWGISTNAGDIDNDGWMDFFVTNGFSDTTTPNVLFRNKADGTFEDITATLQGGAAFDGRGVAFADIDGDGDLDLVITGDDTASTRLWRNDSILEGHWATLKLVGTDGNRSAIGARVEVTTNLGTTVQEVSGGAGRGSFNDLPLEFGLGSATTIDQILIRWTNGFTQVVSGAALDQITTITQAIAGDLNGDGFVGIADLNIVLANWNTDGTADPRANPNGDGLVGIEDLNFVLGNWNAGTPPPPEALATVPEPASVVLLGGAGLVWIGRRKS